MGDNHHHNDTSSQSRSHGSQNDIPFDATTRFSLLGYFLDGLLGEENLRSKVDISLNE
jgi:hypothetical protein